jgi:hypothetical protein
MSCRSCTNIGRMKPWYTSTSKLVAAKVIFDIRISTVIHNPPIHRHGASCNNERWETDEDGGRLNPVTIMTFSWVESTVCDRRQRKLLSKFSKDVSEGVSRHRRRQDYNRDARHRPCTRCVYIIHQARHVDNEHCQNMFEVLGLDLDDRDQKLLIGSLFTDHKQ